MQKSQGSATLLKGNIIQDIFYNEFFCNYLFTRYIKADSIYQYIFCAMLYTMLQRCSKKMQPKMCTECVTFTLLFLTGCMAMHRGGGGGGKYNPFHTGTQMTSWGLRIIPSFSLLPSPTHLHLSFARLFPAVHI